MFPKKPNENFAQKSIRHCIDMIAVSSEEASKGHLQFRGFILSLYKGMYANPESYLVFCDAYEKYLSNRKAVPVTAEKHHAADSRESTLRNIIQDSITFYAAFFYKVGLLGTLVKNHDNKKFEGALVLSKADYETALKDLYRYHDAKNHDRRIQKLLDLGIQIEEQNGKVFIYHNDFPQMMEALLCLCLVPDSKYKWMNYLRCDFKNAYNGEPDVSDICETLPMEYQGIVNTLQVQIAPLRPKSKVKHMRGIVSDFCWKVEYTAKGKNVCGFYADNEYFMLCIYFNKAQNITDFALKLQTENKDLFDWFKNKFPERLCKCPYNRRVKFGEEGRRICGLSNRTEIINPDSQDVENAILVMRMFRGL